MTPKLTYTLNGVAKEIIFEGFDITSFSPKFVLDKRDYTNPFTGDKARKSKGYYFSATLFYEGIPYELLAEYNDIFNMSITDFVFYPDKDQSECYPVFAPEEIVYEDEDTSLAVLNVELRFDGKRREEHTITYTGNFWGNRRQVFVDTIYF